MILATQVALTPIYQRGKPTRDAGYRRFVKQFACVACGGTRLVDPAHTGPHALGQKADDMGVLPACRKCHDEFDADPRAFIDLYNLDVPALIRKFNLLWELKQGRNA